MTTLALSSPPKANINYDLLFCLIVTLVFTHVGEPFAFLEGPSYLGLLILNMVGVSLAWLMVRNLAQRGVTIGWSLCLLPLIILANEVFCQVLLPDYSSELEEILTVVFPFSYLLVIGGHLYYRPSAIQPERKEQLESLGAAVVPKVQVQTTKGVIRVKVEELMAIHLTAHKTMLYLTDGSTLVGLDALSQLTRQLPETADFFNINRRCLANRRAIKGYNSLPDGRLSVMLPGGPAIISKNKAAEFKRWWS